MIARGSLWLPLAILAVLAGLSFWIERAVQLPVNGRQIDGSDPEGIMENFDALRTDSAGNPRYRLSARRLRHYTGGKLTDMELPRFVQLDTRAGEIRVAANRASISADGNEIDLHGEVALARAARTGQSPMTLHTDRLIVYPERELMRAPGAVEIQDALLSLQAGDMEYNARNRIVQLSGRVKARYISRKR